MKIIDGLKQESITVMFTKIYKSYSQTNIMKTIVKLGKNMSEQNIFHL